MNMTENLEGIREAQLGFALKLLQSQHTNDKSLVFSPVSIAIAMATVYLGTQGDTEKQIRNALAGGFDESGIHEYFTKLMERLKNEYAVKTQPPDPDPNDKEAVEKRQFELACWRDASPFTSACVLETFDKAYVNDNINLNSDFVKKFNEFYQGGIEMINFSDTAVVTQKINSFIAEVTRGKIQNVISEANFSEMSKIILINAIYFKGRWFSQFSKSATKDANFYMAPEKTKKAKMMQQGAKEWQYSDNDEFQFLTLDYQYSDLSMKIILPKKRYGLADIIKNLTAKELMKHMTKKERVEVIVKMPRFEVKTEFDAVETLKSMGITDLFESNANLDGMSDDKPIMIDSVFHSAYILTDEEGTEAAAITVVHLKGFGFSPPPPPPIPFIADHPFVYLITDSDNNIYFCGVVSGAEFDDGGIGGSFYQPIKEKISKNPVTNFAKKIFGKKP